MDALGDAVAACPSVSALDGGRFGEVATYLPGRRVPGISIADDAVTIQVRTRWPIPAPQVFSEVAQVVRPLAGTRRIDLVIADIDGMPPDDGPAGPPGSPAAAPAASPQPISSAPDVT